jgi:hypothetical protein
LIGSIQPLICSGAGVSALYILPPGSSPSASNAAINVSNTILQLSSPNSATGSVQVCPGGFVLEQVAITGTQWGSTSWHASHNLSINSMTASDGASNFGGGFGVLSQTAAVTVPTTPYASGYVQYADATTFAQCSLGASGTVTCLPP